MQFFPLYVSDQFFDVHHRFRRQLGHLLQPPGDLGPESFRRKDLGDEAGLLGLAGRQNSVEK